MLLYRRNTGWNQLRAAERVPRSKSFQPPPRRHRASPFAGPVGSVTAPEGYFRLMEGYFFSSQESSSHVLPRNLRCTMPTSGAIQ